MPDNQVAPNFEQPTVAPEATKVPEQVNQAPEQAAEQQTETKAPEQALKQVSDVVLPSVAPAPIPIPQAEVQLKQVENILSQGLESVFLTMDASSQIAFKQKGEQTAKEIQGLLAGGKAKIKKVISLIMNWLRIIPQVNKHFLEQEAKIKADEIMRLYNK
ncbi:hypothetical protein HOD19_03595 [bacterium]|jgi:hypothetical protein|nr:hypothetical protein [bacterium]MBT4648694.1 hypothetical protein [bacterium]